ncbi:hypothetical protein IWW50_004783, partial [Coemansia erecta]
SLSLISVNLLTPALMFSKMTETLDPSLLLELWNEPLFYFLYGGFSLLWSRLGSRVLRLPAEYARLCDVATFFSNTNTLPVSLIKSIALSSGAQFLLRDQWDTPLKVAARGVSYAMIFATLNNILRWSFGVALMGGLAPKSASGFSSVAGTPRTPAPTRVPSHGVRRGSADTQAGDDDELTPLFLGESLVRERSAWHRLREGLCSAWAVVSRCVTPPVYAILAAFVVILIRPLHEELMRESTVLYTLWSAIDMCGDACVPLILISLGGQLGVMAREDQGAGAGRARCVAVEDNQGAGAGRACCVAVEEDGEASAGVTRAPSSAQLGDIATVPAIMLRTATESGGSTVQLSHEPLAESSMSVREQRRGIILVLVGRFVFVPTLAVTVITTLRLAFPKLVPIMAQDPVYVLTLLILSSTPPAINLITVSQATGKFETEAAQILFYGYVLGIFVLAVEVSGFLWLTSVLSSI